VSAVETPASAVSVPVTPLTLRDELARLAPGWDLAQFCVWPPDAFAFTAATFADSGAYRCVVHPPPHCVWPPGGEDSARWQAELRHEAAAWAEAAAAGAAPPASLARLRDAIGEALDVPITLLEQPEHWALLGHLLQLQAFADEASAGAGICDDTPFLRRAADLLDATGTLARLPRERATILPKLRPPATGITLRSLSHHLALDRSEVDARWLAAPDAGASRRPRDRLNLLLLPHPSTIRASDFVPVAGPLANMDESRFGFYEFAPHEPFDVDEAVGVAERARRHVGDVDILVLPEGALEEGEVPVLQHRLAAAGVPYLVAGVRRAAPSGGGFGANYAHFGAGDWQAPSQHKHHRWRMDAGQVHQYHLGAALDPRRDWWEAIGVPHRSITFVTLARSLTVCPLVCEDLARPDPVTDIVRSIAPSLVIALLLDGPQLAARWPARYASVLADDPGCSVLTLTALGMAQRSQPPGFTPSRGIALWKDAHRGLQEISLDEGARAVALTAHGRAVEVPSADGRSGKPVAELVLSGIEQVE
jgi:hypothetical protein